MTRYKVTVVVDGNTSASGSERARLYGLKAAGDNHWQSKPLVWFATEEYASRTRIEWNSQCWIYIAKARHDKEPLTSYSPHELLYGEQFVAESESGIGKKETYRDVSHMAVVNDAGKDLRTGLAGQISVADISLEHAPYCENPLTSHATTTLRAVEKMLLTVSQSPDDAKIKKGTVVDSALSPGVLIDASASGEEKKVHFDENTGSWSWPEGATWATAVKRGDNLTSRLIEKW
ncbi:hypothetical protein [Streptomyces inhibens]|uniref:hypothetical protein n=1 Tax=Streptomyces inhibens TaxID=2293571 RepID=UPI001EE76B9D|nr:hypothetical protein [Streptomyces inhibens]UKY50087.1 hypothetical protein KI385_15470 [Streptomyces inhibens]